MYCNVTHLIQYSEFIQDDNCKYLGYIYVCCMDDIIERHHVDNKDKDTRDLVTIQCNIMILIILFKIFRGTEQREIICDF